MKFLHYLRLAVAFAPGLSSAAGIPPSTTTSRGPWADWTPVEQVATTFDSPVHALSSYNVRTSVDHSKGAWKGLQWHYSGISPESGKLEDFTISIFDLNPEGANSSLPLFRRSSNLTNVIGPRDNWVCKWAVGCTAGITYAAAISSAQIEAGVRAISDYLLSDGGQKMLAYVAGKTVDFAIGISAGVVGWFITNRIAGQTDHTGIVNVCLSKDDWERKINEMNDNFRHYCKDIQAGHPQARTYNHYSEETQSGQDGSYALHAIKASLDSNDFYKLICT